MKRVVLDTNIVVSSALGGALVFIFEKWVGEKFIVVVTTDILAEYLEVIRRPKFKLPQEIIDKITRFIYQYSDFVVPDEKIKVVENDPKDDKFLEAAIAGKADAIVSGDQHLLELKIFRSIPIMTAREFRDWLEDNT
jgi:putative PIN family toxin of toxin-antitoxin system